jgi:hypothetical protein
VVHVAPSRRLRRRQAEAGRVDTTGCVGPCYPCFAVFSSIRPQGRTRLFSLLLGPINRTLEGGGNLPLPIFYLLVLSFEVCHV